MPMTFQEPVDELGSEHAEALRTMSLEVYGRAAEIAEARGIILCDTKFEFGLSADGKIILADEVLTPDSSRFWDREQYEPGKSQDSYDKQFVRDFLETLDWNKQPPGPELPEEVVEGTAQRYKEIYERITGQDWN